MPDKLALVVEDESLIAMLLARLAESCGLEATVAGNGREALEMMCARKPDLVLLALRIPVMSGEELLLTMETDPELRGVPVIVISTQPTMDPRVERKVPHLRKPFEPAEVRRLILEALDGDGQAA